MPLDEGGYAPGRALSQLPLAFSRTKWNSQQLLIATKLQRRGATPNFLVADVDTSIPRLDFVRGNVVDPNGFIDLPAGSNPLKDKFEKTLVAMAKVDEEVGAMVAIFGTGYPIDHRTGTSVPTGFPGIDNVHMNQGAINLVRAAPHYLENGPNHHGGIIFLLPTGAVGIFVKFHSQTTSTDESGNPTVTGIPELDKISIAVRAAIMPRFPRRSMAARRTDEHTSGTRSAPIPTPTIAMGKKPTPPSTKNEEDYIFADVDPADASGPYIPDNDANTYKTPYVMARSSGQTRGPVPAPRGYPRLELATIAGEKPLGYASGSGGQSIFFNVIGDSGAPSQKSMSDYEIKVTDLITRDAVVSPPAFLFHVGTWYIFWRRELLLQPVLRTISCVPLQFRETRMASPTMTRWCRSIRFRKHFVRPAPGRWEGSGGILRSAMTQPGVYFTLDAPLVSIIGLYTNCGESFGWLDEQQLVFLYQELVRLKNSRKNGLPAVLLAVHHFPRWFPDQKRRTHIARQLTQLVLIFLSAANMITPGIAVVQSHALFRQERFHPLRTEKGTRQACIESSTEIAPSPLSDPTYS